MKKCIKMLAVTCVSLVLTSAGHGVDDEAVINRAIKGLFCEFGCYSDSTVECMKDNLTHPETRIRLMAPLWWCYNYPPEELNTSQRKHLSTSLYILNTVTLICGADKRKYDNEIKKYINKLSVDLELWEASVVDNVGLVKEICKLHDERNKDKENTYILVREHLDRKSVK